MYFPILRAFFQMHKEIENCFFFSILTQTVPLIFFEFTKQVENGDFWSFFAFISFQIVRILFQVEYMWWVEEPIFIYKILRKFQFWKNFPSLNKGRNCKFLLQLRCCHHPKPSDFSEMNETCSLTLHFTQILLNMQ